MTLRRWEPFRELEAAARRMERMMDELFGPSRLLEPAREVWAPRLDVFQEKDKVVVKANLPGVPPDKVEVSFQENVLTIEGEVKEEREVKEEDYLLRERAYGSFYRSVTLPAGLDTDKAEAHYENGVLTITIPRLPEAQRKTIRVRTGKTVEGKTV
ncbi:MAG: Hsp20/alpha crystallin family protein [Dehalococcoidia bacterium]|nr:Hsp20/alpha crystallin family protein [Dehalococcoidia bacterium]MDW8119404.1 Hsp20/alpha crystallin family protein [Chloroflexota bacterium]